MRFAVLLAGVFADRYLKTLRDYLHCPPEWLDAADDVDVDALYPTCVRNTGRAAV